MILILNGVDERLNVFGAVEIHLTGATKNAVLFENQDLPTVFPHQQGGFGTNRIIYAPRRGISHDPGLVRPAPILERNPEFLCHNESLCHLNMQKECPGGSPKGI